MKILTKHARSLARTSYRGFVGYRPLFLRFQEEIQRLKDQLAGQGGAVDGDGEAAQVRSSMLFSMQTVCRVGIAKTGPC